jgi:hypothetical protein
MVLNRESFLSRRASAKAESVKLSDGSVVLLRRATAKLYRDYRRSLRDKEGMPIVERQAYGDELLIAAMMVDESGNQLFTTDEVLEGVFDNVEQSDLTPIIRKAYELLGLADEDQETREKNSSATESTEPS